MSNPIQDFINGIVATTQATAQKNKWTPGGFANNVANGAGELAGGVANLVNPFSHTNPLNVAINHPDQVAPMTTNFVKSVAGSLNDTAGQPVNPQTGQFQMPSLAEAEQNAYAKPVDVAANLAMGAGAVAKVAKAGSMLGKAGEVSKAGDIAKAVPKTNAPAGWTSEGMKQTGLSPIGAQGFVSAAKQGAKDTAGVSDTAANTFLKAFTVRREVGKNINQVNVAKQMINDGISGDVATVNRNVKTILDRTEEMKRNALGSVTGGVDVSGAQKQIADGLKNIPELAGKDAKAEVYRQQLQAYLPKDVGLNGHANPLDAYDSMRAIRNLGYDLTEQGKDVYGRTINAEKLNVGKVFINTAKELNDSLDASLQNHPLFTQMNTPENVGKIAAVSPQVAQRLQQIQGWKDMQSLQKPYVDMAGMGKEAQDFANTPGAHLTGQITDALAKGGGASGGLAMAGIPGLVGGAVIGSIASPFIQQAVEKFLPALQTKAAGYINKIQQGGGVGLPSLPNIAKPNLPGIGVTALNQPGQQQAEGIPGQQPTQTMTQQAPGNITPFYTNARPDATGHYQINTQVDGAAKPMSLQDFQNKTAGLSTNDPEYTKIKNQFDMEQNLVKNGLPQNVQGFMRNAVPVQKNANIIADKIGSGEFPMGIINHFDNLNEAAKYVNPKYQGFVTGLDGLNRGFKNLYESSMGSTPSDNMFISPKDSQQQAEAKIAYMTNFFSGAYDQYKGIYSAMSPSGSVNSQGQIQAAQIPVDNSPTSGVNTGLMQQNFPQGLPSLP